MARAIDDVLVGNLQYKLGEGASYVDRRESCIFSHRAPISILLHPEIRSYASSLILMVVS